MDGTNDFDLADLLDELIEIGVGGAILGLRRVNIERRRLVQENPALEPKIDAVLDRIDQYAAPVSAILGAVVAGLGDATDGRRSEQLHELAELVTEMGPQLLRMSGLTARD